MRVVKAADQPMVKTRLMYASQTPYAPFMLILMKLIETHLLEEHAGLYQSTSEGRRLLAEWEKDFAELCEY